MNIILLEYYHKYRKWIKKLKSNEKYYFNINDFYNWIWYCKFKIKRMSAKLNRLDDYISKFYEDNL